MVKDGLQNVLTGLGTHKSKSSANRWTYSLLNDFATLDAMYQSNWIARKIVDIPAEDMTREWRRIKSIDAESVEKVEQQFNVQQRVREALCWSRLFGGGAILMLTNQDLSKPLDVNRIKKGDLKRLITLDRWDMSPTTQNTWDILSDNYLKADSYTIRGGKQQIHHSHFVRFTGEVLPMRWQAQTQGWGDSVLRKCMDDVNNLVGGIMGIAELMQEANVDVIKREGLSDELASDQDGAIINRYANFSQMKSNVQLALLDGEEQYDRKTLNLAGVSPVISDFMTLVSGAADIPLTRFFGTSAKGMNATGEGDDKNYNNSIRSQQMSYMQEPLRQLDQVLVRSACGHFSDDFDYIFNPLTQLSDSEQAQTELTRCQKNVQYLESGIVTKSQIMRELQSYEEYQFDDDMIAELEDLEDNNMFDQPVEQGAQGGEPMAREDKPQQGEAQQSNVVAFKGLGRNQQFEKPMEFAQKYSQLSKDGLTHEQILAVLSITLDPR